MKKDFLIFSYSWVDNANMYFKNIESRGYSCDFVFEENLLDFKPVCDYKNIILYLHEHWTIPITNKLINTYYKNSVLIQHDDTDFEDIQIWSNKKPDLIMHREYTDQSKNSWGATVFPFHFPVKSIYDPKFKKDIDISFVGTMTNSKRLPFINHIIKLAKDDLKHYNWYIDVKPVDSRTPELFKEVCNRSKIGLNYFGNSYETKRTWELASAGASIICPRMRTKIVNDINLMPFNSYVQIQDDFSDIKEKIVSTLENNKYIELGKKTKYEYDTNHTPEKCFDYYFDKISKVINI